MNPKTALTTTLAFQLALWPARPLRADPCGMVPPIGAMSRAITRSGVQKTYVFYKNGLETFVIRPGFQGKVEEFGMLIPFPTPPSIRKVPDNVFPQIAAAVDPPEVIVDLRPQRHLFREPRAAGLALAEEKSLAVRRDVRVLREEAVGMYEVAVLEAGSSRALQRWMEKHGYRYPKGMDATCEDYIEDGWCFVAVKTRIGTKAGVDPRPGMRKVQDRMPPGASFDGHVQAMGFRFRVEELVVPMRLSAFNEGSLRNVVYLLSDQPSKISKLSSKLVVRQIPGIQLHENVTSPLPLRILGGTVDQIPEWRRRNLKQEQDPAPHNGVAKELFASDLLAARLGRLVHPFEESEKSLLRIGEELGLRGPGVDRMVAEALRQEREKTLRNALAGLRSMTLTVIDGDLPRAHIARENLTFERFTMSAAQNRPAIYDAKSLGPALKRAGFLPDAIVWFALENGFLIVLALAGLSAGVWLVRRRRGRSAALLLLGWLLGASGGRVRAQAPVPDLVRQLADPAKVESALAGLVAAGAAAVPHLVGEASEGRDLTARGWAIVCLSRIGGAGVEERLRALHDDAEEPPLVRTWAAAARVRLADSTQGILALAQLLPRYPALNRPIGKRLQTLLARGRPAEWIEEVLELSAKVPMLSRPLTYPILGVGGGTLTRVLVTSSRQSARRQAAAYLATLASTDSTVARAVADAYRFDAGALRVPWHGGALFVPGLDWQRRDARALVGNLIRWHLWCERRGKRAEQNQIHNNIRSLRLAQAAGYQSPGWHPATTEAWLRVWGKVVGKEELAELLREQGVDDDPRYRKILDE